MATIMPPFDKLKVSCPLRLSAPRQNELCYVAAGKGKWGGNNALLREERESMRSQFVTTSRSRIAMLNQR
jgi:hypothetical protein